MNSLAVVAIGRNEGERLRRCLESVRSDGRLFVYVDSGSTDDSIALARTMGAYVVELDMGRPFTAARARNEGLSAALRICPDLRWVQFVDGDCELVSGWLREAIVFADVHPMAAVACGRRRERFPERSIFNAICDIEWNTPIGQAKACGGDALIRVEAIVKAGGYREGLIAGEEPELCVRLRASGWQIHRLDADMTLHDADMTRWSQWWRRTERAGYAFAEGAVLHGAPPERHWVKEARSARLWAGLLPLLILGLALFHWPLAVLVFFLYPLQILRLTWCSAGPVKLRLLRSMLLVAGKFAELSGQLAYFTQQRSHSETRLIEYK